MIFLFLSNNLINKIVSFYNTCLFVLLRLNLRYLSIDEQQKLLTNLNLFPLKFRLFYRFCLFSYKILRGNILKNIKAQLEPSNDLHDLRSASRNIFNVPFARTMRGSLRISIFLPKIVNNVFRHVFNLDLKDFKQSILSNLSSYFNSFCKAFNFKWSYYTFISFWYEFWSCYFPLWVSLCRGSSLVICCAFVLDGLCRLQWVFFEIFSCFRWFRLLWRDGSSGSGEVSRTRRCLFWWLITIAVVLISFRLHFTFTFNYNLFFP